MSVEIRWTEIIMQRSNIREEGKKDVDSINCPYPDNWIIRKHARVRAKESWGTRG